MERNQSLDWEIGIGILENDILRNKIGGLFFERRKAPRVSLNMPVKFRVKRDAPVWKGGESVDISKFGIRLTGMPAWGPGGGGDLDTWKLVHFIRRLKDLTPADLKAMQALNPKSPDELKEEQDDERFLAGETPEASSPTPHHHLE